MPLTCVGKKEILEREKHQQRTYVGKSHVHFPFLAMMLEHFELEGQTWYFYMRYFITRTIAITTTIIAIMIMVRG